MITEIWHVPEQYDVGRRPLRYTEHEAVEIWVGTYPVEPGQSVWICYQEFDAQGNIIPDQHSTVLIPDSPPNPLHYVQCNWIYNNSDDNSYWCGKIGPFSDNAYKVIYNIFARQGNKTITIPSPDFFEFRADPIPFPPAPGRPGNPPLWTSGAKEGFGTALSSDSKVWFSHSEGVINEIYFHSLDKPSVRDFQFLVLDQNGKFNDPKAMSSKVEYLDTLINPGSDGIPRSLAYRITNFDTTDPSQSSSGRYELSMDVLSDPVEDSLLIGMKYKPKPEAKNFRIFALFNPHMDNSGRGDSGKFVYYKGHLMFLSWDNGLYCAMDVNRSIGKYSCGFCGVNDGWTILAEHKDIPVSKQYGKAMDGNIAAIMEINLPEDDPTALVTLSFAQNEEQALERAYRTVSKDICQVADQFMDQWKTYLSNLEDNGHLKAITSGHNEETTKLAYVSTMVLKAMEDKSNKGAIIASPSIPWGDATGDANLGGYHLVWGRDLYNMATATMAVGDYETAHDIIHYLDNIQQEANGSWPQNSWINGTPYWGNEQLDETAYPIILAWRLKKLNKLTNPDAIYNSLVAPAAEFLANYNDTWTQDRWEEVIGRSPFTVAVVVAALVVAAKWADEKHDSRGGCWQNKAIADEKRDSRGGCWQNKAIDFAVNDLKDCYTNQMGKEYYARNFNPWDNWFCKFRDVIDGGFLELVRLGVKGPDNDKIIHSLQVTDQCIRKDINGNPYFLRYGRIDNQDGDGMDTYGEDDEGRSWTGQHCGRGRYWPLLSGERGHYELMKSGVAEAKRYLNAMVASANNGYMLPEQIWGAPTLKDEHGNYLVLGKGTKSATPLGWTHGEFLKLLRSIHDGMVFDLLPEVAQFCKEHENIYNS